MMTRQHIGRWMMILIGTVLVFSCAKVPFQGPESHKPYTDVEFQLNWEEDSLKIPDKVAVFMSRIVNSVHYGWYFDENGKLIDLVNEEELAEDEKQTKAEEGDSIPAHVVDSANLRQVLNGQYYTLAFNYDTAYCKEYDLYRFLMDKNVSMKEMEASIARLKFEDIEKKLNAEFVDFNPKYDFIRNLGPLYVDVKKTDIQPQENTLYEISPKRITQRIHFQIQMDVEEGVDTLAVFGDISGVPGNLTLMSNELCDSASYRIMFPFDEVIKGEPYEEGESKFIPCTLVGHVDAFGIFPSPDKNMVTGPGILQLAVFAGLHRDNVPDLPPYDQESGENEDYKIKIFRAAINLMDQIKAAELLEVIENVGKYNIYKLHQKDCQILIKEKLKVTRSSIKSGEGNQGLEAWVTDENLPFVDDDDTEI